MQNIKNNIPLVVGLLLPVLMIIFVALSVYALRWFSKIEPKYDFLYVTNRSQDEMSGFVQYNVQGNKLIKTISDKPSYANMPYPPVPMTAPVKGVVETGSQKPLETAKFYVHDTETNTSREMSFDDATKLNLSSELFSPDRFEVKRVYGSGGGIFSDMFGGYRAYDYNDNWYLVGKAGSVKLNLSLAPSQSYYPQGEIQFLGWIMQ